MTDRTTPTHPLQPVVDVDGVHHFKANAIVRFLLDAGPFDMNALAFLNFSAEDRRQFAQLIGYSVQGYGELSYASGCPGAYAEPGMPADVAKALRDEQLRAALGALGAAAENALALLGREA